MAADGELAPLIAVVGADGAGKSRLSADLLEHIRKSRPAAPGYLGEGSSVAARKINRWPLIGAPLRATLERIADRLRDPNAPIPGFIAASYALRRSQRRFRRFEALVEQRRHGVVIVTDRYPQAELPGLHDGPILAGIATSERLARIKSAEIALYERMAAFVPTLVIRLNIDVQSAIARKPDHDPLLIEMKIRTLPGINFNNAPLLDFDATAAYDAIFAKAAAAVDAALATEP